MANDQNPKSRAGFKTTAMRWLSVLDSPLGFVITVITLLSVYFAAIEWRVGAMVKDPDFIQEVARRVRPAMVFTSKSQILADMGAMDLLESPPEIIVPDTEGTREQTMIVIHPKRFMNTAPVVESLDVQNTSVVVTRGRGYSWIITIYARYEMITSEYKPKELAPQRYRLELGSE